jgi:hypothetical protein
MAEDADQQSEILDVGAPGEGPFVAPMAPPELTSTHFPVWIGGIVSLNASGMFAFFTKGGMTATSWGLLKWNEGLSRFDLAWIRNTTDDQMSLEMKLKAGLNGAQSSFDGDGNILFTSAYASIRTKATEEGLMNLDSYEAFTALLPGSTMTKPVLDRSSGKLRYAWRTGAPPLTESDEQELLRQGLMDKSELWISLKQKTTDTLIVLRRGSTHWNRKLQAWLLLSSGNPGTIWAAKSERPEGPYREAVLVATHNSTGSGRSDDSDKATNFYNPTQHVFFDEDEGETIYFSGTFVTSFAPQHFATARYDYNSIMYRINVSKVFSPGGDEDVDIVV